jgi:hypothetical protein
MVNGVGLAPRAPDLDPPSGSAAGTQVPRSGPLGGNESPPSVDHAIDRVATEVTSRVVAENVLGAALQTCSAGASSGVGTAQNATPSPMQAKLDAIMASAKGPYRAEGQTVEVPAFFRMNQTGWNQESVEDPAKQAILASAAAGAHLSASTVARVQSGRASAEQVRLVTQALLDAGQLEKGGGDLATRIQKTMWNFGIGMDCADYAQRAFLAVHGGTRADLGLLPDISYENLQGLDRTSKLVKVGVTLARPGDLFILGSPSKGDPGHCVIVYSHEVASDEAKAVMRQRCGPDAFGILMGSDVVHLYQVDSSWGAGSQGASFGGVRRETWLYDETRGVWGRMVLSAGGQFVSSPNPAGHPIVGIYRPRGTR